MTRTIVWLLGVLSLLAACQQSPGPTLSDPTSPTAPLPGTPEPTYASRRWSEPSSWPGGRVPVAGEDVNIPAGEVLLLDMSPPPLGGLLIDGALVFDERDLELRAEWIIVHGNLEVGSAERPFRHRATLTLTGGDENPMGMGGKVLGAMGSGVMQLYGEPRTSWTRLARTARAGDTEITLEAAPDWRPGERIVIASTDFDFEQAEEATIVRLEGARVWLDAPLRYEHWGEIMRYAGRDLDERAEVGLLSRNILVQGDAASEVAGFGGHLMFMAGSRALLHGVEFYRMGQRARMGRYPVHWHLMGEGSRGAFLVNSSVHHSFNRCVTIHGSHGVLVQDTVAYHTAGHCFFLEDGAEWDNRFEHNLGLSTYAPPEGSALLPSDTGFPGPATYWITNPDNDFVGNVAAGSAGTGFWIALPQHPTGLSSDPSLWLRYLPLGAFQGNVAHSNGSDGLHLDRGPKADPLAGLEVAYYRPSTDPSAVDERGRNTSSTLTARIEDFRAYKNRNRGVWLRGEDHLLAGAVLADNAIGATFASHASRAVDSLFVGESANLGTPARWEAEQGRTGPEGRALPRPWQPEYPIRGFEFYDGLVGVEGSSFAGFEANALRPAGALSYLDFTHFATDPGNFAAGLEFAPGTARVYLARRPTPSDPDAGEDGYRSAAFLDADGSVTGAALSRVLVDNPLLLAEGCRAVLAWNAQVCAGRYAALGFENADTAPQDIGPLRLSRPDGASHLLFGAPRSGPNTRFRSTVRLGERYRYDLAGPLPAHLRLQLEGVVAGESLLLSLPYAGTEVHLYRDWWIDERNRLEPAQSLAELEGSSGERYYLADGLLHLKLQARPGEAERDWATLELCRSLLCR